MVKIMVNQYRENTVVISAIRWTGENLLDVVRFIDNKDDVDSHPMWELYCDTVRDHGLIINTLVGFMHASVGDYIIRNVNGDFYPCKSDIFHLAYELVD